MFEDDCWGKCFWGLCCDVVCGMFWFLGISDWCCCGLWNVVCFSVGVCCSCVGYCWCFLGMVSNWCCLVCLSMKWLCCFVGEMGWFMWDCFLWSGIWLGKCSCGVLWGLICVCGLMFFCCVVWVLCIWVCGSLVCSGLYIFLSCMWFFCVCFYGMCVCWWDLLFWFCICCSFFLILIFLWCWVGSIVCG